MLKLASLLSEALSTALPSTVLFDYPSVDALCVYVLAVQGLANAMQTSTARRRSSGIPPPSRAGLRARTYSFSKSGGGGGGGALTKVMRRGRTGSFGRISGSALLGSGNVSPGASNLLEAGRRRASLFAHGELRTAIVSGIPLAALQVIVVESSASRLPGVDNAAGVHFSMLESDAPRSVPHGRWDADWTARHSGDPLPARFASFLQGSVGDFDPGAFGINPSEALLMDPQQRLLLECTYEALHKNSPETNQSRRLVINGAEMGVFVGASYSEYLHLAAAHEGVSTYTASGGSLSVLAGRISYLFGFSGPSTLTDTACSSSLVALNGAQSALRLGQCATALSGAVNLMLVPNTTAMYHTAGMLTLDGRCKTLDAAADGYVRAEAVAATVLRAVGAFDPASSSLNSAVILLAANVNQDGKSSSLTAPNGPAQQALIKSALHVAHVAASEVSTLQLHGTGTALGDPIELNAALTVLMSKRSREDNRLALCAAKASFGHAEPAAGAIGMTAAALALENRAFPGMLHLRSMNPYVSQCISGFASASQPSVARITAPSPSSTPRLKAISSISGFAFQGTNAHAIMETVELNESGVSMFGGGNHNHSFAELWHRRWLWAGARRNALLKCALTVDVRGKVMLFESEINPTVAAEIGGEGGIGWSVAIEVRFSFFLFPFFLVLQNSMFCFSSCIITDCCIECSSSMGQQCQ